MASLVIRNLDDHIVQALGERAARHGRSAEAEHQVILEHVLLCRKPKSLTQVLASMPNVGWDKDFERVDTVIISEARKKSKVNKGVQ